MRLRGLVKALEKKLRIYEEFLVPDELSTGGRLGEVDREIEYYSNPKNF
jgi:hypothetical protein